MKWNTSISTKKDKEVYVRGQALSALMKEHSFSEAVFLILSGRFPDESEKKLFDMILVACIEHGVEVPTAFVPRVSASVGNSMNAALAAGLLSMGDAHGGAAEACAEVLAREGSPKEIVGAMIAEGKRIPGFGHPLYKDADPRAELLLDTAEKLGKAGKFVAKARGMQTELEAQSGKKLPINVDGAIASLMLEMGFSPKLGKALFALGRLPGMIAHAHEEMQNEKPYRRFDESDVNYTGTEIK